MARAHRYPTWAATEHIIQTKLATEAKASDSRARRTICDVPAVGGPVDSRLIVPFSFLFPFCSRRQVAQRSDRPEA
jgi:hypothetical protein